MRAVDGGGRYCEADVHLAVEDANDNPPQFSSDPYTVTVFENTEIGTYVAKLLATDVDVGELNQFIFRIDITAASKCCISPQSSIDSNSSNHMEIRLFY